MSGAEPARRRPGAGQTVRDLVREQWDVLAVIALGGCLGSLARWATSLVLPSVPGAYPRATFTVNVVGCLAIGALMVVVLEVAPPSRYLRPFLGTGVLGGLTTFSAYTLDAARLVDAGRPALAAQYVVGSLVAGLVAVWTGGVLARLAVRTARITGGRRGRPADPPGSPP